MVAHTAVLRGVSLNITQQYELKSKFSPEDGLNVGRNI